MLRRNRRPSLRSLILQATSLDRTILIQIHELENRMSELRDAFEADEQALTDQLTALAANVQAVATELQNLPTSVDDLTQDDLDRAKAQGDALAQANTALTTLVTPAPAPVDPSA